MVDRPRLNMEAVAASLREEDVRILNRATGNVNRAVESLMASYERMLQERVKCFAEGEFTRDLEDCATRLKDELDGSLRQAEASLKDLKDLASTALGSAAKAKERSKALNTTLEDVNKRIDAVQTNLKDIHEKVGAFGDGVGKALAAAVKGAKKALTGI